ncbi:MAG: hypothetical protein JXB49_17405 [Bacteroidales bacterium]|nr:hypothetical protein [Bacteroidales bacterium]MBN2862177.1 hypothetical protein [Bacteroidales bacterium]
MLKVININSRIDLTQVDCAFIMQIINMAEQFHSWNKCWEKTNSLSPLLVNTPVFLLNEESMPKYGYDEYKEKNDNSPPTEMLGFYMRTGFYKSPELKPAVYICPEKIYKHKYKKGIGYHLLLTKIIIHEFAHAIMDYENENSKVDTSEGFYRWIEEPFANWFVLKYFESYGYGDAFNKVAEFIKDQPINYRLGWNFSFSGIDENLWSRWSMIKGKVTNRKKKRWLKFAHQSKDYTNVSDELKYLLK